MGRAEDLFARLNEGGLAAIEDLFEEAANEEAFLEFKRSSDHGADPHLSGKDRDHLARALSGFANSDGGVLVWGVSTRGGEAAVERLPLEDCNRFAGALNHAVSGCTVPEVPGVVSIPIPLSDGTARGYVATLVPASSIAPHQLVNGRTYLVRAGSTFQPVGHTVLAGMFGRRPQAVVSANYALNGAVCALAGPNVFAEIKLLVMAANTSAVVARDAYMSFVVAKLPSAGSSVRFDVLDHSGWTKNAPLTSRTTSFMTEDGKRLAPFSVEQVAVATFVLVRPFTRDLAVELHTGCDGAPPRTQRWNVRPEALDALLPQDVVRQPGQTRAAQNMDQRTAFRMLGLHDEPSDRVHAPDLQG